MISLIGIGSFCCQIVNSFSSYPQYAIYNINTEKTNQKCYVLPILKNAEEYEKNYPEALNNLLTEKTQEVSIFVDGSEAISGIILRFLENYKDNIINIYYVRSDMEMNGNVEKLQDKITFNILQEYTRSGLFNKIVILDKVKLESLLNNVTLLEYENQICTLINSTVHYINIYSNIKPIMSNSSDLSDITKIETYGLSEIGSSDIKWFFDIQNMEEVIYYFAINSNTLKKEKKLFQIIKNQIKEKQKNNVKAVFHVYETNYNENFVYCVGKTKFIQPHSPA